MVIRWSNASERYALYQDGERLCFAGGTDADAEENAEDLELHGHNVSLVYRDGTRVEYGS